MRARRKEDQMGGTMAAILLTGSQWPVQPHDRGRGYSQRPRLLWRSRRYLGRVGDEYLLVRGTLLTQNAYGGHNVSWVPETP